MPSPRYTREIPTRYRLEANRCRKCEKVCPYDAPTVENNLSVIDIEKCQGSVLDEHLFDLTKLIPAGC